MELIECPSCGVRVVLTQEGTCPSCRSRFTDLLADSNDAMIGDSSNPYKAPESSSSTGQPVEGMTLGEKIYTAVVLICAAFMLVNLAMWHFILLPGDDDPGILYFVVSIMWLEFLALAVTATFNLYRGKLLVIPTIIQGVALVLMVWLIPVGIAGFVLLSRSVKRDTTDRAEKE